MRTRPTGTWINGAYTYAAMDAWLDGGLGDLDEREAARDLALRWLHAFGPGTAADLQWWAGWTAATTRAALADCGAVEVTLDEGPGYVAPGDEEPVEPVGPWVALLPGLDPTTMGWKERGVVPPGGVRRHLRPDGQRRPDDLGRRAGRGRLGAGRRRRDRGRTCSSTCGRDRRAEIERRAADVAELLGETRFTVRFPSPVSAALFEGRRGTTRLGCRMTTPCAGRRRGPRRLDPPRAGAGRHVGDRHHRRPHGRLGRAGRPRRPQHSLTLLVVALVVYWAGDSLDGFVARIRGCETRIGAVLDILSDRFCAAAFYLGLVWLQPEFAVPVFIYLAEFMVVDCFLSLAFLAWPVRSPNYFYVIDRPLWLWNWSKPGKAVNSSLFAVLLLVTGWVWLGAAIATALLVLKCVSLVRLGRIGLPVPAR